MKILLMLPLLPILTACSYHSTMGVNDRFHVDSTASLFAPSVTTVTDTRVDSASTYAGPSITGQLVNAAGNVAGGYLLGAGIAKSGNNTSVSNQNIPVAAGGNAASTATTTQSQGQLQLQAIQ